MTIEEKRALLKPMPDYVDKVNGVHRKREVWKEIGYYPGYEASTLGRIRSIERAIRQEKNGTYYTRIMPSVELKEGTINSGYKIVHLSVNGTRKAFTVHRLICLAFLGTMPPNCVINHKNGDKTDNRAVNLEYISQSRNTALAYESGLMDGHTTRSKKVMNVTTGRIYNSIHAAAIDCKITSSAISLAARGITNTAGGQVWRLF